MHPQWKRRWLGRGNKKGKRLRSKGEGEDEPEVQCTQLLATLATAARLESLAQTSTQ